MKFWDLSNEQRHERVSALVAEGKSDVDRWVDPMNADGALDHSRSKWTAKFIAPGSSVIDIGCGAMALKQYLPPGCSYTPCDLVDRGNGCIIADLNRGEYPTGRFDYVVLLGVLEYVFDIQDFLNHSFVIGKNLLLDYTSQYLDNIDLRRNCGWVSDVSPGAMADMMIAAGWKHISLRQVIPNRYLYVCESM